jgi:hypothetical protein
MMKTTNLRNAAAVRVMDQAIRCISAMRRWDDDFSTDELPK